MPKDKYGRWIPPQDGWNEELGFNWLDHWDTSDLIDDIDDGSWEKIGIANLNELAELYQTPEWKELDDTKRINVIKEFQDAYHGDRSNFPWKERDVATEEWGLDIRRWSDAEGGMTNDWEGAYKFFNHMASSKIYPADSKIDWASYNDDSLFDAARKEMSENPEYSKFFGDNPMNAYDTVKEVRTAQDVINNWTKKERDDALAWAEKNVTPNKKDDDGIQEYFPTRKFDPATNTTTYYEHLTGAVKTDDDGNPMIKTWTAPSDPKPLKIVTGGGPGITPSSGPSVGQYYNPEKYGSEVTIKAKMVEEPAKIKAPTITIRDIGQPKKPTKHYMALNDTVWTDPSVDTRSTRWSPSEGKRVPTGHTRKDAAFPTEAPISGGT